MRVSIKAISTYFPHNILTNEKLNEEFPEWSVEKISSKTGIYERRIAGENEFSSDLATEAAKKLFNEHKIDKSEIDFVLLCTQSPDYFLPTTACVVQNRLGLSTNCGALDYNLGCSGYVYGLAMAKGLVMSGSSRNVLLITAETYSKFIHKNDKSNRTIFGDAAAATLVSKSNGEEEILNFTFGTDGSGAENLIVKNGGVKHKNSLGLDIIDEGEFKRNDDNLFMNGQEIFKFTTSSVPKLVDETLLLNNIDKEKIDLFVFHQANKFMLDYIRRRLNIPVEKFFMFFGNVGNTVSSTIPIALEEAIKTNKIKKGMKVLIAGFGVGYSSSATIINF